MSEETFLKNLNNFLVPTFISEISLNRKMFFRQTYPQLFTFLFTYCWFFTNRVCGKVYFYVKLYSMLKISIFICLSAFSLIFSQDNFSQTEAKIIEAKIYSQGGFLKQSFSAEILPGKNFIVVKNFGRNGNVDISSFKPNKKVTLIRFEYYHNNASFYNGKFDKTKDRVSLHDSIELYKAKSIILSQELALIKNSQDIIEKNQVLENPSSEEILKLIDFNQVALKKYYAQEKEIQGKIAENQSVLSRLEKARYSSENEYNTENQNAIVLQVSSDRKQNVTFDVHQSIQSASWRPYYVIKSEGINSPLKISYKAKIQQNTGLEFKNIPIKLINGNFNTEDKPYELDRWFLQTQTDYYVSNQAFQRQRSESSSQAYSVAEVSVTGNRISQRTMKTEISLRKDAVLPSDVELTEDLNDFEVATAYKYFSTPKIENKTFLLASIKDYSKYNFLPGNADIYMDDMQIGTVHLDTNQLTSEMMVSLGNDTNVLTKRELINKETKNLGEKEKKESYTYEITIKNNKDSNINMELKDQIPLSTTENVNITLFNPDNAKYDQSSGFLVWNFNIKPNETKKITFGFNVTLPKDLKTVEIR